MLRCTGNCAGHVGVAMSWPNHSRQSSPGADRGSSGPRIGDVTLDGQRDQLLSRLAVAVTLAAALEFQSRLASNVGESFAKQIRLAHGEACHQVAILHRDLRALKRA